MNPNNDSLIDYELMCCRCGTVSDIEDLVCDNCGASIGGDIIA